MATTVKSVRPAASLPPRSAEARQALHRAIERHADALARAERVAEAQQRLDADYFDVVRPAVSEAREALGEARSAAPQALVDRLLSDEPVADGGPIVAQAEAALAAAEEKLAETRQARSLLGEEAARIDAAVNAAGRDVEHAVAAVVLVDPARAVLLDEFNRSARRALRCAMALRTAGLSVGGAQAHGLRFVISDAATTVDKMGTAFVPDAAWRAAIDELRTDADAALPGLPEPEPDIDDIDVGQVAA